MSHFRRTISFLAFFTFSCVHANLTEALRFVPAEATTIYFTDWAAITVDMRDAWPSEPTVGDTPYVRALADRHAPPTATAVASDPWYVSEVWGWSMLDLEWELETNERLVILAFAQGVDTSSLLDLIAERNYATDLYEGFTLYPHNFDMSLVWLRPPFSAFQNAAFMEDDRVLMLAPTLPALRAAVDAYSGRTSNLTQDPSALALALALDESVGTLLLTQAAACGAPVLDATERAYDLAGVGYRPTELGTRGLTALARLDEVVMNIVTLSAPGELFSQVCSRSADFLACAD